MNLIITKSPVFLQTRLYRVRNLLLGAYWGDYDFSQELVSGPVNLNPDDRDFNKFDSNFLHKIFGRNLLLKKIFNLLLSVLIFLSVVVVVGVFVPRVYYSFFPAERKELAAHEEGSPLGGSYKKIAINEGNQSELESKEPAQEIIKEERILPQVDENLPDGDWLIIPKIGVRSQLQKTATAEEALATGIWWVPDFGSPGDKDQPMIVAGHRYGWKWWWKDSYWKYHSFYLLPDLRHGDIIEVISEKRKWTYEIYAGEEGDKISDYNANLILYTCKFLNSPLRHFRYARLIDLSKNSQE